MHFAIYLRTSRIKHRTITAQLLYRPRRTPKTDVLDVPLFFLQQQQPQWPPVDRESGTSITLPEDIWWQNIRPYCPVQDRPILSKQCSTRFPPSNRRPIDDKYINDNVYLAFFYFQGSPGNIACYSPIRFRLEVRDDPRLSRAHFTDLQTAWDEHLQAIPSPSVRLLECLLLLATTCDACHGKSPLFFPGEGTFQDILKYHLEVNPMALNGLIGCPAAHSDTTILEHFVDSQYALWVAEGHGLPYMDVIDCLIEAGATDRRFLTFFQLHLNRLPDRNKAREITWKVNSLFEKLGR